MSGQDLGKLLLRIAVGGLMLVHGIGKLKFGIAPIVAGVTAHGLPPWVAYGVYLGEVVAPILLILGALTRVAGVLIAIDMVVAVALMHTGMITHFSKGGGYALELQAMYFASGLAVSLLGPGRCSVTRGVGTWR
jgi:putative oxidoreductase